MHHGNMYQVETSLEEYAKLGESQVEVGTQIPLGDKDSD